MVRRILNFLLPTAGILALALAYSAHNRDTRFEQFIKDFEALNDEVVRMITDAPTPTGVAEARHILNARKDDLQAKLAELKTLSAGEAGGEKLTRVEDCLKRTPAKISAPFFLELGRRKQALDEMQKANPAADKHAVENARRDNEQFISEMELLLDDYESIIY